MRTRTRQPRTTMLRRRPQPHANMSSNARFQGVPFHGPSKTAMLGPPMYYPIWNLDPRRADPARAHTATPRNPGGGDTVSKSISKSPPASALTGVGRSFLALTRRRGMSKQRALSILEQALRSRNGLHGTVGSLIPSLPSPGI